VSDTSPLPPNTIQACVLPGISEDVSHWIKPCSASREWMDEVPQRYIYRCVPMVAANTMGWELCNPVDSEIIWDGSELNPGLTVKNANHSRFAASSHFGCGIATWYLPFLFRTSPDLGLVVTGPANHGHDNATPLDAFVRTDWLPFPFTMNWRLTRRNEPVVFKAGEPICRIYPYPIALLENTRLEIHNLDSDPAFLNQVNQWGTQRQANVSAQQQEAARWQRTGEKPTGEGVWNSQYVRARGREGGEGFAPHQTAFRCQDPEDHR
jgi:hypothetical protein